MEYPSPSFGSPWFPPPFPMPPLPFNPGRDHHTDDRMILFLRILGQFPPSPFFPPPPLPTSNPAPNFIPPSFLPPPPPPDLLSKMLQTPPPPLPVPPPVNNSLASNTTNINNDDLYDPLKVEDEDEIEEKKPSLAKPVNRSFNIKKEYTIKIEPSNIEIESSIHSHFTLFCSDQPTSINSNRKFRFNFFKKAFPINLTK